MKMLIILPLLITVVTSSTMNDSSLDDAYLDMVSGSLCDNNASVAIELMRKTDECIINEKMKKAISDCRAISYGSEDQWEAKDLYCSKGQMMREQMDDLFNICLQEQGLDVETIQAEWVANCGFCENPQLVLKTETCFQEGDVKEKWHECREEIFGTRDPIIASNKYCASDRDSRLTLDESFDDCLYIKGVTREAFDAALQEC